MNRSSVIVFKIDVDGISIDPTERNAPVSACVYGITALVAADERMETEAWQVHVLRPRGVVERAKNIGYPFRVLHAQRRPSPVAKKRSSAFSRNERIIRLV
jgi:hypothetical protein